MCIRDRGLVPYGDIRPITAYDPTLTFNTIGRPKSMLVRTRLASTGSPWLSKCAVGDEDVYKRQVLLLYQVHFLLIHMPDGSSL